jgi:hypothetical protein
MKPVQVARIFAPTLNSPMFRKYLASHSELAAFALLPPLLSVIGAVAHVLCIPFYDEEPELLACFAGISAPGRLLQIWNINAPDNADNSPLARTRALLHFAVNRYRAELIAPGVYLTKADTQTPLLIVDQCSAGRQLPHKQGVGLARKIALDLALKLVDEQQCAGQGKVGWLHTSDADVILPDGYFDVAAPHTGEVGLIYPLRHRPDPGLELAQRLYDFRLDYYVAMLSWAGSAYAFQAVGSTIAVTPEAYAAVRGMPKRSGGEDFYLLNKLAKLGRLRQLALPVIEVAARASHRVPFGTGPALSHITGMADPLNEYHYYHPQCFVLLKALLDAVREASESSQQFDRERLSVLLHQCLTDEDAQLCLRALAQLGLDNFLAHCQKLRTKLDLQREFTVWFDAFLTLRFVHLVRDGGYAGVSLSTLKSFQSYFPIPTAISRQI